tara:strand:+ start:182 stop:541 length:360 start_codon:yes stop_codon:yes gene_type:complete
MSHPSKIKGNKFERDCCKLAEVFEIPSKRAWGSDGRSLGLDPEVDIVIGDSDNKDEMFCQCKIRKRLPEYIFPKNEAIDCQLIRQDRGETYIVLRYEDYLAEMRRFRQLKKELEEFKGS